MARFTLPRDVYHGKGSLAELKNLKGKKAILVVGGGAMKRQGFLDKAIGYLKEAGMEVDVFEGVEPDPSVETVMRGAEAMRKFEPDWIVAMGGGSPIDAAKAMWAFYEYPETTFEELCIPFNFPELRQKAKFAAIPSTSGTATEVTAFSVITNYQTGVKYPLADYALTPDVAIIDPQLVMSVPASVTADTGMDVLTHAIESYVSVMASDYTRGLSLQAIKIVFEYLEKSVKTGDAESREKMHNASTMAGMAFANAFLGISHSIAHKVGGAWGVPHGRTNAILLPHVIRYNAKDPQKHAMFPKYDFFRADTDYADIARFLGLKGNTTAELVEALASAVYKLGIATGIEMNWQSQGLTKKQMVAEIDHLAEKAYEDQCTTANPKQPLISELKAIIEIAYDYKG